MNLGFESFVFYL